MPKGKNIVEHCFNKKTKLFGSVPYINTTEDKKICLFCRVTHKNKCENLESSILSYNCRLNNVNKAMSQLVISKQRRKFNITGSAFLTSSSINY